MINTHNRKTKETRPVMEKTKTGWVLQRNDGSQVSLPPKGVGNG